MKIVLRLSIIIILFSCNKNEAPQEQVKNDCIGEYNTEEIQNTLVSAFLDLIMHYRVYYYVINKEA